MNASYHPVAANKTGLVAAMHAAPCALLLTGMLVHADVCCSSLTVTLRPLPAPQLLWQPRAVRPVHPHPLAHARQHPGRQQLPGLCPGPEQHLGGDCAPGHRVDAGECAPRGLGPCAVHPQLGLRLPQPLHCLPVCLLQWLCSPGDGKPMGLPVECPAARPLPPLRPPLCQSWPSLFSAAGPGARQRDGQLADLPAR